jgi:hypothetical protein
MGICCIGWVLAGDLVLVYAEELGQVITLQRSTNPLRKKPGDTRYEDATLGKKDDVDARDARKIS